MTWRWPSTVLGFVLVTVVAFGAGQAHAQERLNNREISQHVEEYANEETSAERRAEIVRDLIAAGHSRTRNALRAALRADATRLATIELIGRLRHDRAWEMLADFVRGADADNEAARHATLDALFDARDERGLNELVKLWAESGPDRPLFNEIARRLRDGGMSAALVDDLIAHVGHETRGTSVRETLAPQFALPASEPAAAFEARWRELRPQYRIQARRHTIQGTDLLREGTFMATRTVADRVLEDDREAETHPWLPSNDFLIRRDENVLLESRQRFEFNELSRFDDAAFTITLRFLPVGDVTGYAVGLQSEQQRYECEVRDGRLHMPIFELRGSISAPVRANEWNELVYTSTFSGGRRVLQATVNGRPFEWEGRPVSGRHGHAPWRGRLFTASFRGPAEGQVVIGGFDVVVTDPNARAAAADQEPEEDWRNRPRPPHVPDRWRDPRRPPRR